MVLHADSVHCSGGGGGGGGGGNFHSRPPHLATSQPHARTIVIHQQHEMIVFFRAHVVSSLYVPPMSLTKYIHALHVPFAPHLLIHPYTNLSWT